MGRRQPLDELKANEAAGSSDGNLCGRQLGIL